MSKARATSPRRSVWPMPTTRCSSPRLQSPGAGSTEGPKLREGLLAIENYQGLIKNYAKPFTDENHDALNENDYVMVRYNGDQIEPVTG